MNCIHFVKYFIRIIAYPFLSVYFKLFPLDIHVKSIEETVVILSDGRKSLVRYGDGEIKLMNGGSIYFQPYNKKLAEQLSQIISCQDENLMIGIADVFNGLNRLILSARIFWKFNLFLQRKMYRSLPNRIWANSFLSRPYIDYKDKDKKEFFALLQRLWENKDIVFVEGETTRNGIGNDLYKNAKSIQRVICPASNAYSVYEKVELFVQSSINKNSLILLSLGPAAKVIAYDLYMSGFQVIDIGHLDPEYEWFLRGAKYKSNLNGKHSAESSDVYISDCIDENYHTQIIARFL